MSHLKGLAFESDETHPAKLRERLRKMSDEELIKFGKMVRGLSAPRVGVTPDPWKQQLAQGACRMEATASENIKSPRTDLWPGASELGAILYRPGRTPIRPCSFFMQILIS